MLSKATAILKFKLEILEMQQVCMKIKDKETRGKAIKRIDTLIELEKIFEDTYFLYQKAIDGFAKLALEKKLIK